MIIRYDSLPTFDHIVMIRGRVVGVFKHSQKKERDDFLDLGFYLMDVQNVEEEYPLKELIERNPGGSLFKL